MKTLLILNEVYINGYLNNILDIVSILAILSGIFVLNSKNPIVSVLFLIGLFANVAIYLNLIGLNFIGLSYLIVYIGAVSILFLFILMLINIRISELLSDTNNYLPLAMLSIILFFYIIGQNIPYFNTEESKDYSLLNYKQEITFVLSNNWDTSLINNNHISSIGNILYTNYSIWLLITSIILLLAMVGSIVITVKIK